MGKTIDNKLCARNTQVEVDHLGYARTEPHEAITSKNKRYRAAVYLKQTTRRASIEEREYFGRKS